MWGCRGPPGSSGPVSEEPVSPYHVDMLRRVLRGKSQLCCRGVIRREGRQKKGDRPYKKKSLGKWSGQMVEREEGKEG